MLLVYDNKYCPRDRYHHLRPKNSDGSDWGMNPQGRSLLRQERRSGHWVVLLLVKRIILLRRKSNGNAPLSIVTRDECACMYSIWTLEKGFLSMQTRRGSTTYCCSNQGRNSTSWLRERKEKSFMQPELYVSTCTDQDKWWRHLAGSNLTNYYHRLMHLFFEAAKCRKELPTTALAGMPI